MRLKVNPQFALLLDHAAAADPAAPLLSFAFQVDPQFFAFRWITLLLTQEFSFPDAVRIWDTLLADPGGRLDCLLRVCLALLLHVRQQLLEGACFSTIIDANGCRCMCMVGREG